MEAIHDEHAPTAQLALPDGKFVSYTDYGETSGSSALPVIICLPGIGDLRSQYRFLAPILRVKAYCSSSFLSLTLRFSVERPLPRDCNGFARYYTAAYFFLNFLLSSSFFLLSLSKVSAAPA